MSEQAKRAGSGTDNLLVTCTNFREADAESIRSLRESSNMALVGFADLHLFPGSVWMSGCPVYEDGNLGLPLLMAGDNHLHPVTKMIPSRDGYRRLIDRASVAIAQFRSAQEA